MAPKVLKRLINVNEYYKMAEVGILKPDDRLELINGEIYEMSSKESKHAAIVNTGAQECPAKYLPLLKSPSLEND